MRSELENKKKNEVIFMMPKEILYVNTLTS